MNKIYVYLIIAVLFLGACADNEMGGQLTPDNPTVKIPTEAMKGELLIKFQPEMSDILDRTLTRAAGTAATRSGIPSIDEVLSILGSYRFERLFPVDPKTEERTRETGMHLWYVVYFDENSDLEKAVNDLKKLGEVSKVQCNKMIHRAYDPSKRPLLVSKAGNARVTRGVREDGVRFNDPELYRQWGYINRGNNPFDKEWAKSEPGSDVGCEEAWKLSTGDPSIIIAVLDEGVMFDHPDLAANMWVNEGEEFLVGKDNDNNGYKDDKYGFNFVDNTGVISYSDVSDTGHGTHVAGTIAAVNDNGIGGCGIAGGSSGKPGVKIMTCQIFSGEKGATLAMEAKAIKYAADNGAVILQCSWGYNSSMANMVMGYVPGPASEKEWNELYPLEKEALDYFINNAGSPNGVIKGGLAIFAAGNEYSGMPGYPGAYSKCMSISAIAADFTPSSYTNFGPEVAFSAPGGDSDYYGALGVVDKEYGEGADFEQYGTVYSTLILNGQAAYGYMEGTSMACPHVSGVAALGLSYAVEMCRHFTAPEFINLMKSSVKNMYANYPNNKKLYHYNHSSNGSAATQVELSQYVGKMGTGLIDAGVLLKNVANSGTEMLIPNIYVAPTKEVEIDLSRYFVKGKTLIYTCSISENSIASASVSGSMLKVKGLAIGSTEAVVKISNGKEQKITITVRKNANGNGWL